jgi:hypothetical protein
MEPMAGLRNWKMEIGNWLPPVSISSFLPAIGRLAAGLAVAVVMFGAVHTANAQGCAMCYTSAAAAKKAGMQALQNGILILLFPPLLMFAGIIWFTFRRRAAVGEGGAVWDESEEPSCRDSAVEPPSTFPVETIFQKTPNSNRIERRTVPALRE